MPAGPTQAKTATSVITGATSDWEYLMNDDSPDGKPDPAILAARQFTPSRALEILQTGEFRHEHGVLPWGSNYCFLLTLGSDQDELLAIYKPQRGERELWDFPRGTLCYREVAAYETAMALGWSIVPPTTLRDGPYGIGSLQCFIHHDPEQHYFNFNIEAEQVFPQLKRLALFDCLINNADRKGGHCLLDAQGQLWGIDHGVCFHSQPKLRTVIWDFAGESLPEPLCSDIASFTERLTQESKYRQHLSDLLSKTEINALSERAQSLLNSGHYPQPGRGSNYPWPPV